MEFVVLQLLVHRVFLGVLDLRCFVSCMIPVYLFSEFYEVMDIPDLHQKALRAGSNSESTKIDSVDPSVSGRSGIYNCRHDVIKDPGLLGSDNGLLSKFPMFRRYILP